MQMLAAADILPTPLIPHTPLMPPTPHMPHIAVIAVPVIAIEIASPRA